jgi:sugar lactone lactonase YvrE
LFHQRSRVDPGVRAAVVLITVTVAGILGFVAWPSPIDSRPFRAGPMPEFTGPFEPNRRLEACRRISVGDVLHADKLLLDEAGRVYAGDERGRILRLNPDESGGYSVETYAEPLGRPMELAFDPDRNLVVADLEGPHVLIDADRESRRLQTLKGLPLGTAGVAVARDGVIYYGAHTERHADSDQLEAFMSMLAARPSSQLRAFDPRTGEETVLIDGLLLPVGVELSANEDFVAVAEFFAYRVTRYWLAGPKAGTSDRLVENLPGVVDGLASDGQGTFYLTLPAYRTATLDWMHERPWVKNQVAKLLPLLLALGMGPGATPGVVIALDESGRILRSFQDPEGRVVATVTAAEYHQGNLYLTSIAGDWIARCPIDG